ncbi:RidA family protein [Micromonospora endophytica]|uniref:RidA family protein n=1 Tax=Micromonospora endophytica TaxID=515350 RepID=A0A2W2D033_9ACTN|nr:RidA family protein [Micromonospora endophytica]PZF99034.1 RidA family protein [Micromonospora endophytica]RIW51503.1 RidA family protein [Micromonospora endophytica]
MTTPEQRVAELGLVIPDYADPPYGERYGAMKPFHRAGHTLTLSGMTPEDRQGNRVFPGRVGLDVTPEQGYQAARYAAVNVLGLIRYAVGSLDEVAAFVRTLCLVVVTPEFSDVNLVANGAADLFVEVFGDRVGRATSASMGVLSLSGGNVFEILTVVQTRE